MLNNIAALIGGGIVEVGDYESIATVTVGSGGSSTVSFSSIPSTYKHLQIRSIARSSATNPSVLLNFNGDSSTFVYYHLLYGTGSAAGAYATNGYASIPAGYGAKSTDAANIFGANVVDILDYTSANKNKTVRTLGGYDANGSGEVGLYSGQWLNSSTAVNSIVLKMETGNFAQNSSFALYGIK